MADAPRILILTAVRLEARAVAAALSLPRISGTAWGLEDIALHIVGIRATRLAEMPVPRDGVIMAGLAGALSPALRIADVVLDDQSRPMPRVDGLTRAAILTADAIAATPGEKAGLFERTGALAVEMENGHIRAWAGGKHVAYCGVRGISDTADHLLDPATLSLVDELGDIKPGALAKLLLTRPRLIPQLRALGANAKKAANAAAEVVQRVVSAGWPGGGGKSDGS